MHVYFTVYIMTITTNTNSLRPFSTIFLHFSNTNGLRPFSTIFLHFSNMQTRQCMEVRLGMQKKAYEANPRKKFQAQKKAYDADPSKKLEARKKAYEADPSKKLKVQKKAYEADPSKKLETRKKRMRLTLARNCVLKKNVTRRTKHYENTQCRNITESAVTVFFLNKQKGYYRSSLSKRAAKLLHYATVSKKPNAPSCSYTLHEPKQHVVELYVKHMKLKVLKNGSLANDRQ